MSTFYTTLASRNLTVSSLIYKVENNQLTLTLTSPSHNLFGKCPIIIAGCDVAFNQFNDTFIFNKTGVNTLEYVTKDFDNLFVNQTTITGTITANIAQASTGYLERLSSSILYNLQDGYILDGATLSLKSKLGLQEIETTEPLISFPSGVIDAVEPSEKLNIVVNNITSNTNIPLIISL